MNKSCTNCNNENLIISQRESKVMPKSKYAACTKCGKVMMLMNDILIPTPTDESPRTKLLIQDAADCFTELMSLGGAASLDGQTTPVNMQPTQALESAKASLLAAATTADDEEYEVEYDEYYEDEYDLDDEEIEDYEDMQRNMLIENTAPEYKDYLLVHPSGEKQLYRNTSKDFMINIINDIGSHIMLYELKAVELKTQITYSF